ncbi:restriction endonuclease subunit S [uncultured Treponema sp.]|uniref:restriction endonuclease subunit S n=1 Tax=uncultured Treponema sp. TaxID=162155 RepID=UPI0025954B99|nr:restriction endonuclease subunit S [uncultured Treponema sp.]
MKMEEWKECKLGDFFELHRGYDLTKSEIKEGPYPVVCSTSIMGYHNEYKVKAPGVVIGRSGTLGEVQFIDTDYWPHNTSLYVSDFKGNFPKFIKYFLQLFGTGNVGGGSAVPTLNRNHLQALTVRVPPLPTQQKIAAILSSLDDKIELNNKINTNLEQQAQALFKNWFVDFAPFGGKMPEEWKVGKLSEIAEITSGKRPPMKQSDYSKDVSIPLVGAASVMGYTNQVLYNEPILITGRVGTHGVIQRFSTDCWPSDNTLVVKSKYYEYVYQIMKNIDYDNMNRGSTQPLITQSDLGKVECIIPDEDNLQKFKQLVNILFSKVQENQQENQKLVNIRDTLLPKLMNGAIEV